MPTQHACVAKLLSLFAAFAFVGTAGAHGESGGQPGTAPALHQYSLVSPYHLPHVMRELRSNAGDYALSETQRQALDRLHDVEVRPALLPRLREAQQLEREISRAALEGQDKATLAPLLDRLQKVKREAAEMHIDCVQRVRAVLTPEQYAKLVVRTMTR